MLGLPPLTASLIHNPVVLDLLFEEGFLQERTRYWMYVAVMDERTCKKCDVYSGSVMTTYEVHSLFPYGEEVSYDLILPNTHPNCRCMLVGARDDWGYTDTARVILAPPDVTLDDILSRANKQVEAIGEGKMRMSADFWLIRAAFLKVFGPQVGGKMFLQWVRKNHFRVTKTYGTRFTGETE